MIRLERVCERTFSKLCEMKLPPDQNRFVAPNVVSLAQAWLYYDNARPFAICDDDAPVGFVMLDWDERERTVGVWRFMIAHEHQNKGYGRRALELAIEMARASNAIDMMHLDYVPGNTIARELYASLGFMENGVVEDGEIVMTLPLTDHPKLGMLPADADDTDELLALLEAETKAGSMIPSIFNHQAELKKAIEEGSVLRFTWMGESVGLAMDGELFLQSARAYCLDEAWALLRAAT